jgi:hypothetical protein
MKKPVLISDAIYDDRCTHLIINIDAKEQIKFVKSLLFKFIKLPSNRTFLSKSLNSIFDLKTPNITSYRVVDKITELDIIIEDEGKEKSAALLCFILHYDKKNSKLFRNYKTEDFFRD